MGRLSLLAIKKQKGQVETRPGLPG